MTPLNFPEITMGMPQQEPAQHQGEEAAGPNPIYHMSVPGYESLAGVLRSAYLQAAAGKGAERHASGEPFHDQPICAINRLHGSIDGALFQAAKKAHEARRLPTNAALRELYGAINYLAAAAILIEEGILEDSTTN